MQHVRPVQKDVEKSGTAPHRWNINRLGCACGRWWSEKKVSSIACGLRRWPNTWQQAMVKCVPKWSNLNQMMSITHKVCLTITPEGRYQSEISIYSWLSKRNLTISMRVLCCLADCLYFVSTHLSTERFRCRGPWSPRWAGCPGLRAADGNPSDLLRLRCFSVQQNR